MALSVADCVFLLIATFPRLLEVLLPFCGTDLAGFLAGVFVVLTPFLAGCTALALLPGLVLEDFFLCVVAAGCAFLALRFFCAPIGRATKRARSMVRSCFIYMLSILLKTS